MPMGARPAAGDAVRSPPTPWAGESCLAVIGRSTPVVSKAPWYGRGDLRGSSGVGAVVEEGEADPVRLSLEASGGKLEVAGDGMRNSVDKD